MQDIITVAQSTFYRLTRMPALYLILVICVLDVAAMSRYGEISLGLERQLTIDAASAILLIVALFSSMVAAFEIPRELRDKTATYILAKPSGRSAYIWGKFIGIGGLVAFNVGLVAAGALVVNQMVFDTVPWALAHSAVLTIAEGLVLVGLGLLLSINLSDTIAAVIMFALFVAGHMVFQIPRMAPGADILANLLPNFHLLDIKTAISHGVEIDPAYTGMGLAYGLAFGLAFVGIANIIFSRKDLQ